MFQLICPKSAFISYSRNVHQEVTGLEPTNEEVVLQELECGEMFTSEQSIQITDRETEVPRYYIHQEDGIDICSYFLVGKCNQNALCPRHHTVLPYLWQLRVANTKIWYSVEDCGQDALERLFSDPKRTQVTAVYQLQEFILDFTTMRIHQSSVFDYARRLSTSTSPSVPFHTCYNFFYEEIDNTWVKYSTNVVKIIEEGLRENYKKVFCPRLKYKYVLCLSKSYQQNLDTGTKRRMRARPVFISAALMMSELWTFSNCGGIYYTPINRQPPVSSAQLRHLYPKTWLLYNISGYDRVNLRCEDKEFSQVYHYFHKTMPECQYKILEICRIQNYFQWEKYTRKKNYMTRNAINSEKKLVERYLFHGTDLSSVEAICRQNFDSRVSGRNGTSYGQGCYFAKFASYSHRFSTTTLMGEHYMFLAKVLVGRTALGSSSLRRPPPLNPENPASALYDSCVSRIKDPHIFVIFDNDQFYPYFFIRYCEIHDKVIVG